MPSSRSPPQRAPGGGEVRTGVDFDIDFVPTVGVEGFVTIPSPDVRVQVTLAQPGATPSTQPRFAMARPDGSFSFRGVPPGDYILGARGFAASAGPRAAIHWGSTHITISGDDIEWFDPERLEALAPDAFGVSLQEDEAKAVELRLKR